MTCNSFILSLEKYITRFLQERTFPFHSHTNHPLETRNQYSFFFVTVFRSIQTIMCIQDESLDLKTLACLHIVHSTISHASIISLGNAKIVQVLMTNYLPFVTFCCNITTLQVLHFLDNIALFNKMTLPLE